MAQLSIHLLGPFLVEIEDEPIVDFSTDKVRALLAYLAVAAGRPHRRESLAGLFWPNVPERSARISLRTALSNLRLVIRDKEAVPTYLDISRKAIGINKGSDIEIDVLTFKNLLKINNGTQPAIDKLEKGIAQYKGKFLEGFSLNDSVAFTDWALVTREQLERQAAVTLDYLTTHFQKQGDEQTAVKYARHWVDLDPWQEIAQRKLMELLARLGQRAAALAQFETCRVLLAEELGVEPEIETIQLYERIREGMIPKAELSPDQSLLILEKLPSFLKADKDIEVEKQVFVARERELNELQNHLEKALKGRGRVVFIVGGAGRGKTVLMDEFRQQALSKYSILAASGYCNAYSGIGDPYLPFRQVLEMLSGDVEGLWASGQITREQATFLWQAAPYTAQAIVDKGPDLIESFIAGNPLLKRVSSIESINAPWLDKLNQLVKAKTSTQNLIDLEQQTLLNQYTQVIERVAQFKPMFILLDDYHWSDSGSIDLLLHLGRKLSGSRVFILCAYRPDEMVNGKANVQRPLEDVVQELKRLYGNITIDLAKDDPVAGREFVDKLLDIELNRLDAAFRRELYKHTHGHPLFTVEMLRMLQEHEDIIRSADGHWVLSQTISWDNLPARVEAVIQKRLNRLDVDLLELLNIASVEGEEFTVEVIERVSNIPKRSLLKILTQELSRRHRLLREQDGLKSGNQYLNRFRFSHYLIQHYLYNSLSQGERRLLHEEIAQALEDLYVHNIELVTIQLAFHYKQTSAMEKALHYLIQAGHQSRARYDNEQAVTYYTEALELLTIDDPDRFHLLKTRSEVLGVLAQRDAQKADIEAMKDLAKNLNNQTFHCETLLALTDYYLATEPFLARTIAEKAYKIAQEIGDTVNEANALRRLAWAGRLGTDFHTSLSYIENAADRFIQAKMPGEAANCLFMLARRLPGSGEHYFDLEVAEQAMALAQQADDYHLVAMAKKNLAIAHINWGRYSEAKLLAEDALSSQRDLGNKGEECNTLDVLAIILARLGKEDEATAILDQCLSLAEKIGSDWGVLGAVFGFWNYVYVPKGNYHQFLAFVETRLNHAISTGREWLVGFFGWIKTLILAELGQLESALSMSQIAVEMTPKDDLVSYSISFQVAGSLKAQLNNTIEARQDLEKALDLAEKTADPYLVSWHIAELANLALIEGNQENLIQGLRQAQSAADVVSGMRETRLLARLLTLKSRIHLNLGMHENALDDSMNVMRLMKRNLYLPSPQNCHLAHFLALRANGQENKASKHLQDAYDRVMFVANKLSDESRQNWLQNVKSNVEILRLWNER